MEIKELRKNIKSHIDQADYRILNLIHAILDTDDNLIVAHTVEGEPLNKKAYKEALISSMRQIERGEVSSQEDLEKESENW